MLRARALLDIVFLSRAGLALLTGVLTTDPSGSFVEGTTWRGKTGAGEKFDVRFDPAGHLHYETGSGSWDTGTWVQNGNDVDMETNGHYADYHGVIQGDAMIGNAHNVTGLTWTWTVHRSY